MINTTAVVKLNISESVLQGAVRRALSHASDALRKGYELVHVELASVSTKTNPVLGFSKFIELGLLKANTKFDSDFLQNAFACSQHNDTLPGEMFHRCFPYSSLDGIEYKRAYSGSVKKGIGLFLLSLHCAGAITLPVSFNWPSSRNSEKSGRAGRMVCEFSELMSFVRSVETVSGCSQDPAFKMLRTPKRAEWFSTYATKLLLATGWSKPEEANYQDLFKIFEAQNEAEGRLTSVSVFVTLAQILKLKFGSRIAADFGRPDVWKKMLGQHRSQKNFEKRAIEVLPFADTEDISGSLQIDGRTSDQVFSNLLRTAPAVGSPTKLKEALKKLPTDHPLIKNVGYWLDLQEIYFLRRKRENYNPVYIALGYLNLYLCYYLPAWFRENPSTQLAFPSTPDLLVGTVYISRVLSVNLPLPRTFMEYMNERSREALWEGNTYYAKLSRLKSFSII